MTTAPTIEVYADIWCPFAHVGLRAARDRIAHHRASEGGGTGAVLVVRAWPLERVNGRPQDPAATVEHAHELRDQVAPDLFAGLDAAVAAGRFPSTTLPALALTHRAYRESVDLGERMAFALRDALFEQGRDISDPSVLDDLAAGLGVPAPDAGDDAAVLADWEDGRRRGVVGSPHFFSAGGDVFCPALRISRDGGPGLTISETGEHLARFLDACLDA
jgi:2-hydroxychromene-2-carboxylate isomerase